MTLRISYFVAVLQALNIGAKMNQIQSSRLLAIHLSIFACLTLMGCSKNDSAQTELRKSETIVVNLAHDEYDEYIGRGTEYRTHMLAEGIKPGEEGWIGNPHPIGWCDIDMAYHTRDECIAAFKVDFYNKIETDQPFRNHVLSLQGKRLGGYCSPEACHGDVISAWVDSVAHVTI